MLTYLESGDHEVDGDEFFILTFCGWFFFIRSVKQDIQTSLPEYVDVL